MNSEIASAIASADEPVDELIRLGPFKVMMPVPARVTKPRAHFLVSGAALAVTVAGGTASRSRRSSIMKLSYSSHRTPLAAVAVLGAVLSATGFYTIHLEETASR